MQRTRIALLAGGMGTRMKRLGHNRLKPLVPFGGTCHLIDFSIDNAYRSGASEVLLMAQHNERKLARYLLDTWCSRPGFKIHFGPYEGIDRDNIDETFAGIARPAEKGTADALIKNAPYIFDRGYRDLIVLHADHVYRFDYRPMVEFHRQSGAALTIGYQAIELEYVKLFGMVEFDREWNLRSFVEKPVNPTVNTIFSAVCVFHTDILRRYLDELAMTDWQHDISRDVIPAMLANGERIKGFPFTDYWEDIGTVERYYRANMRLLAQAPTMRLPDMPLTLLPHFDRRRVERYRNIENSIVASDCETHAHIEHSLIYPGTRIANSVVIRNSIVLPGAKVPDCAVVERAILLEPDIAGPSPEEAIMQMEPA